MLSGVCVSLALYCCRSEPGHTGCGWLDFQWVISLSVQDICRSCSCIHGNARMMWCLVVRVIWKELFKALTWSRTGCVLWVMMPLPRAPLSMACCRALMEIWHVFTVPWSMKLPEALKSTRIAKKRTVFSFTIWVTVKPKSENDSL